MENKLKSARMAAGLTQQQLADASGVNIRQIRRVELGTSEAGNMSARNLLAIAKALNVDPEKLI
jgi:transcriptional regulator with XRE-family HTH domain